MAAGSPAQPLHANNVLKVVEHLLRRKELSSADVQRAIADQKEHGLPFAELLVLRGKITEKRLLSAMTVELGVPFVSSEQLAGSSADKGALERIPVRLAERMCVFPVEYSARRATLHLAVASLDADVQKRLHDMVPATFMPLLACEFAIRAAIRRFYHSDSEAFERLEKLAAGKPLGRGLCSNCGSPLDDQVLHCSFCGLMSRPSIDLNEGTQQEPSVVRALLSRSESGVHRLKAAWRKERKTVAYQLALVPGPTAIPHLVANLHVALEPLHPFEGLVASSVDGRTTVEQIAKSIHLSAIECGAVLSVLAERQVIAFPKALEGEPKTNPGSPSLAVTTQPGFPPGTPPSPAEPKGVLQRALQLERDGHVDEAIATLEDAVAATKSSALYNRLALILFTQRGDAARAERLLEKALELDPHNRAYETNLYTVRGLTGRRFLRS